MSKFIEKLKADIKRQADDAFKDHEITCIDQINWPTKDKNQKFFIAKVQEPETWMYGFFIGILPGCISVWGDIGELQWTGCTGERASVQWLEGALRSPSYLFEKLSVACREHHEEFYDELADEYIKSGIYEDYPDDEDEETIDEIKREYQYSKHDMNQHVWDELMYRHHNDGEFYRARYYSHTFLFIMEALKRFVDLYYAGNYNKDEYNDK